jgi:hypothetical protein
MTVYLPSSRECLGQPLMDPEDLSNLIGQIYDCAIDPGL